MVEVVRMVATYLMVGVLVQMLLQGLAKFLESPTMSTRESVTTVLTWPIALLIFMWYFVKGFLRDKEE